MKTWTQLRDEIQRTRPPVFLVVLMATLLGGWVGNGFEALRPFIAAFRLSPAIWEHGEFWRWFTFGWVGHGRSEPWFLLPSTLLSILIVYPLVLRMVTWMRARRALAIVMGGVLMAGIVATGVQYAAIRLGFGSDMPFLLVQGQNAVLAVAFASGLARDHTVAGNARPYLVGLVLFELILSTVVGDYGGGAGMVSAMGWGWAASVRRW